MIKLNKEIVKYFPYPTVRPYQDEFVETVFEAVESGHSVLIEGCNGLGKTAAALSACLPSAMSKELKILYAARTHRQHDRVIEELKAISRKQEVSGVSLRGRREMCLNQLIANHALDTREVMDICELLKTKNRCSYYRNIEKHTRQYMETQQQIACHACTASEIQRICNRGGFCPYEVVKSSLASMNVVAMSYLYVFDPAIRNAFLRSLEAPLQKTILIVDEAHNLPEVAVDIESSTLSLFVLKQAEAEAREFHYDDVAHFIKILRGKIEEMAEKIEREARVSPQFLIDFIQDEAGISNPQAFLRLMQETGVLIKRTLLNDGEFPRSFIHGTACFLLKWFETLEDQSLVNLVSKYRSKQGTLTARLGIVALDPSKTTAPVFSSVYSNVIMSGTLQPLEAYQRITRLPENTVRAIVPSPFPKEHVLALISSGVTTAMQKRTPEMYNKIVKRIGEVATHTPANTGIFAPSFEVLGRLLAEGLKKALNRPLFCEHRSMDSKENEKMVADFKSYSMHGGAALLGVQGGRSSEGVDFPGNEMDSVVIVGLPYAEPTPKVKAQIDYFEKSFPGLGYEYGYVLPAMKKASQAAGRPMRSLEDRGAMVFLDDRFSSPYIQRFLPSWIRVRLSILPDKDGIVGQEIRHFFKTAC